MVNEMSHNIILLRDNRVSYRPRRRVLFIFPYDWLTSPRSVREVCLLKNSNYEPLVISTKTKYLIQSGACISSSPKFDLPLETFAVYHLPFFVTPLILPKLTFVFKICFLIFNFISTLVYTLWLFFLTLLICVTKRVSLIYAHNTPDLTGLVACLVSKITRIPYVYEVHDLTPELFCEKMSLSSNALIFKLLKKIEYIAISNSVKNIFTSKAMQNHSVLNCNLAPSKCVVVYSSWSRDFPKIFRYNGNELNKLLKEASLDNKFKIIYLGSMEDGFRRGLDILIESMRHLVHTYKLTDIALIFVGNHGETKNKLIQLTRKYQLSSYVSFKGMLPRQEAYKWLKIADVAIHPLRKAASTETVVSNKLLEYMAAGKVIIASDLAGHREIIRAGFNGLLFQVDDPVDLADKINLLIARNDLRKLGSNARKDFCEKYCWERQKTKILDLCAEILQTFSFVERKSGTRSD